MSSVDEVGLNAGKENSLMEEMKNVRGGRRGIREGLGRSEV